MKNSIAKPNIGELNPFLLNELLIKYCRESNISKWDMGASSSRDLSVQVQNGNAKQLKGSQRNSLTLRVWNKKKVGITSTSDLTNNGIKKAIKGAIEASIFGNENESPEFSSLAKSPLNEINQRISKEHGEWTYPLWPNQSLQGSPPTPYIYDSRPVIDDIVKGLHYWYNMSNEERTRRGKIGRDWAIKNNFTKKGMCNEIVKSFEGCFKNWKPLERMQIINTSKPKPKYPSGVIL